jgi:hypothetical protein
VCYSRVLLTHITTPFNKKDEQEKKKRKARKKESKREKKKIFFGLAVRDMTHTL